MALIWSIVSAKGGTGKSTITSSLGAALCRKGNQVLLIDMDEGLRCLDFLLGVAAKSVYNLGDVINGKCSALDAVLTSSEYPGLYILPATVEPGTVESKEIMRLLCDKLSPAFDFILIDCPSGIGENLKISAYEIDNILVVTTPDPSSVRAAAIVKKIFHNKNIRLVINKIDIDFMLKFLNIDEIIDMTEIQLIAVIPTDKSVMVNGAMGLAVTTGVVAEAFDRLAERFMGLNIPLPNINKII